MIRLTLGGPPAVRREPNIRQNRPYPHAHTKLGMASWRLAWQAAGAERIEGPVAVSVRVVCRRPPSHFGVDGQKLNATGRRAPVPTGVDLDNVVKLVLDALKTRAFADDRQVAALDAEKRWAGPHENDATSVYIWAAT